jgi:hypothetical protein
VGSAYLAPSHSESWREREKKGFKDRTRADYRVAHACTNICPAQTMRLMHGTDGSPSRVSAA